MRIVIPTLLAATLVACQTTATPGELGTVAYVDADDGALHLVDVATGDNHILVDDQLLIGPMSFSVDGSSIAFVQSPRQGQRDVYVVDTATGTTHAVSPSTGGFQPWFLWLRSGWFWYSYQEGAAASATALVGPGNTNARMLGTYDTAVIHESTGADRITYADCVARDSIGLCASDLVVEKLDGTNRTVIAHVSGQPQALFTRDDDAIVYTDTTDLNAHGFVYTLSTGERVDLGVMTPWSFASPIDGTSHIAPDGSELLAHYADRRSEGPVFAYHP